MDDSQEHYVTMSPHNNTQPETGIGPNTRPLRLTPESDQSLSTEIVMGVARAIGIDSTQLHESLHDVINPAALNALFQSKADGTERARGTVRFPFHGYRVSITEDGTILIESELKRLKQRGVNLLVCGTVPDSVRDEMSTRLLGDGTRDRTALLALTDRSQQTAQQRLADAQIPEQNAQILSTTTQTRSATAQTTEMNIPMSTVSGTLEDVQTSILQMLSDCDEQRDQFDPAELRFCFDSLRPFIEMDNQERLTAVLTQLCEAIKQRNGMGHFLLPYAFASAQVQRVRSHFDIVVELRIGDQGPEYRWHLQTTDFTTRWRAF